MLFPTMRLAWKTSLRQKGSFFAAVLGISASLLITVSLFTLFGSMHQTARNANEDLYGAFTDIWYRCPSNAPLELGEKEAGRISVSALSAQESDTPFAIGYADSTARALGHIRLKSGRMPQNEKEIALEASVLHHLGIDETLGAPLTLAISTQNGAQAIDYTLVGVIRSYSALWVKNGKLPLEEQRLPGGFVTAQENDRLKKLTGCGWEHALFQLENGHLFTQTEYETHAGLTFNNLLAEREAVTANTKMPLAFVLLVSLCAVLVVSSILQYALARQKKRWSMLRLLGLSRSRSVACLLLSLLLYYLSALPLGMLGGIGLSNLLLSGIEQYTGASYLRWFPAGVLLFSGLVCLLPVLLSGAPSIFRILKISPMENFIKPESHPQDKGKNKKAASRPVTTARLSRAEPAHLSKTWVSVALLTAFLLFFNYFSIYLSAFSFHYESEDAQGKIASDYDFQFTNKDPAREVVNTRGAARTIGSTSPQPDSVYFWNNFSALGCPENLLKTIKEQEGIARVKAYKETDALKLQVPSSRSSPYLDVCGRMSSNASGYSTALLDAFGYSAEEPLLSVHLGGYSEQELKSFAPFVEQGEIRLDQLRAGNEVILVVPTIHRETTPGGGILYSYPSPEKATKENTWRETKFRVGDELPLSRLTAQEPMKSGYLSLSQAQKHLRRVDKTVKIGAIIYQNAGWFEQPLSNVPTISLLTLNESFDKIGGKSHYARVAIERQEKAELSSLENELKQVAERLPNMNLHNRASEMEAYRSNHFLLSFSSHVFLLFLAAAALTILCCQNRNQVLSNERRYALLRANGVTSGELSRLFFTKSMRLCTSAALLALPLGGVLTSVVFYELPGLYSVKNLLLLLASILCSYLISALSVLVALPLLRKNNLSELFRQE